MGECWKALVSFFLALTLKFFTNYGNISLIFHSDKISEEY